MNMENERRRELVYQALVDFGSGHLTYHFSDGTQQGGWFEITLREIGYPPSKEGGL